MNRRRLLQVLGTGATASLLSGCSNQPDSTTNTNQRTERTPRETSSPTRLTRADRTDSVTANTRIQNRFQYRQNGEWQDLTVKGINLGMGKPGRFPGEAAISRAEYDRWLTQMADMHANAIRVYTVHPPAFYEALLAHNEQTDQPLYLFHGNWLPARLIEGDTTAYDDEILEVFDSSLQTVVDVINGNADLADRPGYASGSFTADVSDYTLGIIAGIEWAPRFVARTNSDHPSGETAGQFVQATSKAQAFERWLADRLNNVATYEATTYGSQRPLSFANWPTTDHLTHPAEPLKWEDAVSVNPNTVITTDAFTPGVFATYHAYPYYPDFQNFSEKYTTYTTDEGKQSSYAGYLNDLIAANDHSVVIGEYGVPGSRGIAHEHVHGADQGHHTETQQGTYDAELFETLMNQGAVGGLVFAWQDEWFKRTWNTMRYTDPNRRPNWLNVESPEERFGLLSFDPSAGITLSGSESEWAGTTQLYSSEIQPQTALDDGFDASRSLTGIHATTDEGYLYLRVEYTNLGEGVDWTKTQTVIGIDTTSERGNTLLPRNLGVESESGIDFVIRLGGPQHSETRVASHYDLFYYEYGHQGGYLDPAPYASEPDNGIYHPIRMALSYPLSIPTRDQTIPFRAFETGKLRYGTADPSSEAYDSLTDVHVAPSQNAIELRIPWLLLNFRDPSSRKITGDVWQEGLDATEIIRDIGVIAATYNPSADQTAQSIPGSTNATDTLPSHDDGQLRPGAITRLTWDEWQTPQYQERLKDAYHILGQTYARY